MEKLEWCGHWLPNCEKI